MSDWKTMKLGDVAAVQTGPFGSQLHESDYVKDGTPIITVENLIGGKIQFTPTTPLVASVDVKRLSKYMLKEGDVVFSRVGAVDRSAYCTAEADSWMFSGRILRVRPKSSLDPKYLNYYLSLETIKNRIRNHAVGGTMASLNTSILNSVPIVHPPLNVQRQIVAILGTWDDHLEKLDNKIALKKNIKKGLMQRYFSPESNSNHIERVKLGSVINKFTTGLNPRDNFKLGMGNNYYVTIKNINNGSLKLDSCEMVDDNALKLIAKRSQLEAGDVIMASIGNVGESYLVQEKPLNWNINESVFNLKPDKTKILPEYLYYTLTSSSAKRFFDNNVTGSSFKSIKMKDLREMLVLLPELDVQREVVIVLKNIDAQITENIRKRHVLNTQKRYLLNNCLNGKLRTSDALHEMSNGVQNA